MSGLRNSPLRVRDESGDINPLEGLANLADLMLVLACGLMLALVIHWNVNWGDNLVSLEQGEEVQELQGLTEQSGGLDEQAGYQELGVVYQDPATGKLYMVTKE